MQITSQSPELEELELEPYKAQIKRWILDLNGIVIFPEELLSWASALQELSIELNQIAIDYEINRYCSNRCSNPRCHSQI